MPADRRYYVPFQLPLFGADSAAPALTDTAGHKLTVLVPPRKNSFTRLLSILYTVGTTAHTLTVLREKARTTTTAAAAGGQAVINLAADPGKLLKGPNGTASSVADRGIAANDWLAFELADGTFWFDQVASVSTLAITLQTNLPSGTALTNPVLAGAVVWFFGLPGDQNPLDVATVTSKGATPTATASAHPVFDAFAAASGTQQITLGGIASEDVAGLCRSPVPYSPILVQSNNATVAGTIEHYAWSHSDR